MQYINYYQSPLGKIVLVADDRGLIGLWFDGQKHSEHYLDAEQKEKDLPIFEDSKHWLDIYFSGREPDFKPQLHFLGTDFQNEVWEILCSIPYGKTMTYGELAGLIAAKRGVPKMSAQAIGGAVGRNRISIIAPCHRVIGANGSLTGYAGGIDRKRALLGLENACVKIDIKI